MNLATNDRDGLGDLYACQDKIGYRFRNIDLLVSALTHSSVKSEMKSDPSENPDCNERMEFLGDAILGMVVTEEIFQRFPDYSEGELTRIKSFAVSRRTLAKLARSIGLPDHIRLGRGMSDHKSLPISVLANVVEAVIAAVYMDTGYESVRNFVINLLSPAIEAAEHGHPPLNYKSLLQQYTQRHFDKAPVYRLIEESGPNHNRTFVVVSIINGNEYCRGRGKNKKEAEQRSAKATFNLLKAQARSKTSDTDVNTE